MKYIQFKKIYIQNFLSVGLPGISLSFQEGINLITGINYDKDSRNGVGKSTIIESLYWCLFGETMREIKKDQVVNNINKKDCLVTLDFIIFTNGVSNNYTITREAKPSKVTVFENDTDVTKSTISKADDYITKLISSTGDVFQNAVIMTANNTTPFMAQRKGDKRKFIEEMLRLSIFGEMSVALRNDFAETKKQYEIAFDKNQNIEKNIKLYQEQHEKQNKSKEQKIEEINNKISLYMQESENIKLSIKKIDEERITESLTKVKSLPIDIEKEKKQSKVLLKASHELEFQIKHKQQDLDKIDPSVESCHACDRPFHEDHKHVLASQREALDVEIKKLQNKLLALREIISTSNSKISNLEQELEQTREEIHSIKIIKNNNENFLNKINQINLWVDHLEKDKENVSNEENNFTELISNAQIEFEESDKIVKDNHHKLRVLDSARFVISEEGVKSYIVKKMLSLLNNKLNFYLTKLEAPCRCFFNEFFEEIIINDRNQECSYFNFSGGERKRIDLAVLFMFQDIRRLQSDVSINISMYDELFDSALDERGSECILNLLKERVDTNNESIYIVSHNKNTVKTGINNIISLEKKDGFTKIVCNE